MPQISPSAPLKGIRDFEVSVALTLDLPLMGLVFLSHEGETVFFFDVTHCVQYQLHEEASHKRQLKEKDTQVARPFFF